MIYNVTFKFHKSYMFYSYGRIDILELLLKSHISKKIATIQNSCVCIIFIDNPNLTIKYNVQAVTLITFFKNILILLKVLDGCGMIQLR